MEMKKFFRAVTKGALIAILINLLLLLILSLFMIKFEISPTINNYINIAISILSLSLGSILASKINGSKGILVGLCVGILFYLFLLVLTAIASNSGVFTSASFVKFLMTITVGILAGILGINL